LYWKRFQRYFVHEIMARDVITVKPTDNLDYCMELMSTKNQTLTGSWKQRGFSDFDRRCSKSIIEPKKKQFSIWTYISGKNHNKE
jgi:CBS domain-containing protein